MTGREGDQLPTYPGAGLRLPSQREASAIILRKRFGLSDAQIGRRLGVSRETACRLRAAGTAKVRAIVAALGADAAVLVADLL